MPPQPPVRDTPARPPPIRSSRNFFGPSLLERLGPVAPSCTFDPQEPLGPYVSDVRRPHDPTRLLRPLVVPMTRNDLKEPLQKMLNKNLKNTLKKSSKKSRKEFPKEPSKKPLKRHEASQLAANPAVNKRVRNPVKRVRFKCPRKLNKRHKHSRSFRRSPTPFRSKYCRVDPMLFLELLGRLDAMDQLDIIDDLYQLGGLEALDL